MKIGKANKKWSIQIYSGEVAVANVNLSLLLRICSAVYGIFFFLHYLKLLGHLAIKFCFQFLSLLRVCGLRNFRLLLKECKMYITH